jgi:hypothetical protein
MGVTVVQAAKPEPSSFDGVRSIECRVRLQINQTGDFGTALAFKYFHSQMAFNSISKLSSALKNFPRDIENSRNAL